MPMMTTNYGIKMRMSSNIPIYIENRFPFIGADSCLPLCFIRKLIQQHSRRDSQV